MFTITSKTESTLGQPATANKQSEQVHSFRYSNPGVLQHQQNYEDFSHGVESVLERLTYHLLPGSSDVLATWHNGSDFIVVIRGFGPTSVISLNDIPTYKSFMKEFGSYPGIWHLVAPFPRETQPNPANYTKFDPRRGY